VEEIVNATFLSAILMTCGSKLPSNGGDSNTPTTDKDTLAFVMRADLSYVNQILDHGGTSRDSGLVKNPYKIFSNYGTDVGRLRLWHDPDWTAELYEGKDCSMYNDLDDVTRAIREAKDNDMAVNLDFHYSDRWADPDQQNVPEAWKDITDLKTLEDTVYAYTREGLEHLNSQGLMPEYVQVGNETNCGLMYWEPAWITSDIKDRWATGSSWENNTLFDFEGNAHTGFEFMLYEYN
jgi:arabinogalactan endo-1,4-beta-galactosidase